MVIQVTLVEGVQATFQGKSALCSGDNHGFSGPLRVVFGVFSGEGGDDRREGDHGQKCKKNQNVVHVGEGSSGKKISQIDS